MDKKTSRSALEETRRIQSGGHPEGGKYRSRPAQLLRCCLFQGVTIKEVVIDDEGEYSAWLWQDIRERKPIGWPTWRRIAKELRVEPSSLCDMKTLPLSGAEQAFSERVQYLLVNEKVPHDLRGRSVDVVNFLWQMQDPVLDRIPLTYVQQARALRRLCREDIGLLIETWTSKARDNDVMPRIGRMYRAPYRLFELEGVFSARAIAAAAAFKRLAQRHGKADEMIQASVQAHYRQCLKVYHEAVVASAAQDHQSWNKLDAIIDADEKCRGAFFRPGYETKLFTVHYAPSRRLIHRWRNKACPDFQEKWPGVLRENTAELERIGELLKRLPMDQSQEMEARNLAERCINRTKALYQRLVIDLGYPDPVPEGEEDYRMEGARNAAR